MTILSPHYVEEGKSYLTIAFGCTGWPSPQRDEAEEVRKRLCKAGYSVKGLGRDI